MTLARAIQVAFCFSMLIACNVHANDGNPIYMKNGDDPMQKAFARALYSSFVAEKCERGSLMERASLSTAVKKEIYIFEGYVAMKKWASTEDAKQYIASMVGDAISFVDGVVECDKAPGNEIIEQGYTALMTMEKLLSKPVQ